MHFDSGRAFSTTAIGVNAKIVAEDFFLPRRFDWMKRAILGVGFSVRPTTGGRGPVQDALADVVEAMAAASFRRRTAELADLVAKGGFWSIVPTILQGQILPTLGGSPIQHGGRVIGAIGCGGGTGEQDQECSDAGAAALAG
jgi:Haem degrading protein HbpS-like